MVYSALVYLALMGLMILTESPYYSHPLKEGSRNIPFLYCLIPSLLFAIVFGVRYGVGTDHIAYVSIYRFGGPEKEVGYEFLQNLFKGLGFHFSLFFGFIAFLQISLFSAAFKDRRMYPWIILTFFLECRWLYWCNGIRQSLAACIFIYAVQFISDRKLIPYVICILFAMLFHKSALILIPFFFIDKIDLFKKPWLPWVIYVIAIFIHYTNSLSGFIDTNYVPVAEVLGYDDTYALDEVTEKVSVDSSNSTGYGHMVHVITTLVMLVFIQPAKKYYKTKWFIVISNLFLIWLFGYTAFAGQAILYRPFGYFSNFRPIILAYILFYLVKVSTKNKAWWIVIVALMSLTFLAVLLRGEYNTAEYHAFWEFGL